MQIGVGDDRRSINHFPSYFRSPRGQWVTAVLPWCLLPLYWCNKHRCVTCSLPIHSPHWCVCATMIATVLGPVDKSSVTGSCSAHEHLLQKPSPADIKAIQDNPITLLNLAEARSCGGEGGRFTASNRLFSLDESVQEVRSLVDAGGGLVLECSTPGRGRDPSGLADISTRTGINVVMAASSTGKYVVSGQSIYRWK